MFEIYKKKAGPYRKKSIGQPLDLEICSLGFGFSSFVISISVECSHTCRGVVWECVSLELMTFVFPPESLLSICLCYGSL
jgi:hypothetical protein